MDLRHELMEGRAQLPRAGAVVETGEAHPPFIAIDGIGREVEPVTAYLRDLALSDSSPLTARSYAFGMLRWFRLLWLLDVAWERATEAETAVLTGWLRTAPNPRRRRRNPQSPPPGTVNPRTGKPYLSPGYSPTTINHALSVVSGFYTFHAHYGRGPVANPVPASPQRRRALSHLSPLAPKPVLGRSSAPREHPDHQPLSRGAGRGDLRRPAGALQPAAPPGELPDRLRRRRHRGGVRCPRPPRAPPPASAAATARSPRAWTTPAASSAARWRHYQEHLEHRRQIRPTDEYRDTTSDEWTEFEEHFDRRKVELGSCARPYGTPCQHEHACFSELTAEPCS